MYEFSRKMFLSLYSINWTNFVVWLPIRFDILGNMCLFSRLRNHLIFQRGTYYPISKSQQFFKVNGFFWTHNETNSSGCWKSFHHKNTTIVYFQHTHSKWHLAAIVWQTDRFGCFWHFWSMFGAVINDFLNF